MFYRVYHLDKHGMCEHIALAKTKRVAMRRLAIALLVFPSATILRVNRGRSWDMWFNGNGKLVKRKLWKNEKGAVNRG